MPLRFPNPGSDISRLVNTYRLIYMGTQDRESFDLDTMSQILTTHHQASSRGAVGEQALARSRDEDRSRDPLYNQSKMYSEIFRMLGWMRPGARRLEFAPTILGHLMAEDFAERSDLVEGLLRECLLGITFPNSASDNVGVENHRPFRWLLLLTAELGGTITRHEMILGLLAVIDDREPNSFEAALKRVRAVRGKWERLVSAVARIADESRVQVTTLENYTRFPVGVLKSQSVGWATSGRESGLYEKPTPALVLTTLGRATAERLRDAVDVRESSLQGYTLAQRAHFANYGYYAMLVRSGVEPTEVEDDLAQAQVGAKRILNDLDLSDPLKLIYSPVQQADDEILDAAASLEEA